MGIKNNLLVMIKTQLYWTTQLSPYPSWDFPKLFLNPLHTTYTYTYISFVKLQPHLYKEKKYILQTPVVTEEC
jgi:hypothetical protein